MEMTREYAMQTWEKYNKSESLKKHALAVEAAMRYFAKKYGEDENYWSIVGLLHDVDYELYPEEHLKHTPDILRENGYDDEFIHAVVSHGYGLCADVKPEKFMEKVLFTVDELTGLVTASVYMRPDKKIEGFEVSSLKKKFKSKGFAAGCSREVIQQGCDMLGMALADVMADCIAGMAAAADELGL